MVVKLIVAMDKERGIGKNNDLMWHLPADMKFFKETTTGHVVVMGRKNWDSIPEKYRPLPNRENVVLTRNKESKVDGAIVFHSLEECLSHYNGDDKEVYIIGGGEIYRNALDINCVDEMYITHVDKVYDAETFFPEFNTSDWTIHEIMRWEEDERNEASFIIKRYLKK
jgi:dihydrofolate reductase